MKSPQRSHWGAVVALAALAAVVGCSALPTAPQSYHTRSVQFAGILPIDSIKVPDLPPGEKPPDSVATTSDSLDSSQSIVGTLGGEVKAGRFNVELPPFAIVGDATVSIHVDDANVLRCELRITPASANGFARPVNLKIDCSGVPHVERLGIVWLNEVSGEWEEVPGSQVDVTSGVVSAPLQHFSQYAVTEVIRETKAGW
jgi:hypothetical protein